MKLWRACDHFLMSDTTPRREEDYQALITFIGRIGRQLQELGQQVDDEELSKKLLDLAHKCIDEFFGGVITDQRKPEDDLKD